jgi:hypothetical protein
VLVCIDFDLPNDVATEYCVTQKRFSPIDKTELLRKIGSGFPNSDGRELTKINQWEKLQVFDDYFRSWNIVVYLDAGMRVLDDVKYLLELDCKNKFLCHKDEPPSDRTFFRNQLSLHNLELVRQFIDEFGDVLDSHDNFLNTMWMYDTAILDTTSKEELIDVMQRYPMFKCNEMTAMNCIINYKHGLWVPFPQRASNGKLLCSWSELDHQGTNWTDHVFIKYAVTTTFDV